LTYRTVLVYLVSSHIDFADLASTLLPLNPAADETRKESFHRLRQQKVPLPLPVSPKSIYRLADLLELPTLKNLALDHFKTQLMVENVARELFSNTSALYNELRAAALDFAVEHWSEVKETEAMKEIQQKGQSQ
jgi:hypothetical protein